MDWEERVLPSIGNEVVKAVVAQYNAEQLLTQRDKVRRDICYALGMWTGVQAAAVDLSA
jgi:prohibitin 1